MPSESWFRPEFDDSSWAEGRSGFGTIQNAWARVNTPWKTPDLWIRRTFDLSDANLTDPHLRIFHDDAAEVFLNGEPAAKLAGYLGTYFCLPLGDAGTKALRRGTNTLAVHVHQDRGGQYIDVGLVEVIEK